jgi:hypothetical protein
MSAPCICVSVFVLSRLGLIAEKLAEPALADLCGVAFSLGFNFCFVSPLSYSADLFLLCARALFPCGLVVTSTQPLCIQALATELLLLKTKPPFYYLHVTFVNVCVCVFVCESVPPFIQIRYNLIAPRKGRRRRRRHTMLSAFSSGMRFISMIVLSTLDQKGAGLAHGF